jgi:hypothetical protein
MPSMIFQNVRQTLIVLCATPRPCLRSSSARHLLIISNVIESGTTSPHMFLIRNHAGHHTLVRADKARADHSSVRM